MSFLLVFSSIYVSVKTDLNYVMLHSINAVPSYPLSSSGFALSDSQTR